MASDLLKSDAANATCNNNMSCPINFCCKTPGERPACRVLRTVLSILFLLAVWSAPAQIIQIPGVIPSDNLPATGSWQGMAGVPGGIDQYSTNYTMFCNVRLSIPGTNIVAYGDGIHDDTAALNFAIQNATNESYVYIPTGTYLVTGGLWRGGSYNYDYNSKPFSIIIRGDGPTNTILLNNAASGEIISFFGNSGVSDYPTIAGGNVRGSTSMVLSNGLPGLKTGAWVLIEHSDAAAKVYFPPAGDPNRFYYTYTYNSAQFLHVTNISGNTISFSPPLNEGYPGDLLTIHYSTPFRCGIENLGVVRLQDINSHNIRFIDGRECWIRNVESRQARGYHISLEWCAGCEVRQCFVHDPFPFKDGNTAGGGSDYGITLGFHSSSCLVEDNIALHCRHSFILETAAGQNNVIAYNYGKDNINEGMFETDYQGDTDYHGGEPRYNLFEGNVLPIIRADAVEGATKYDVYFRNLVTRDGIPSVSVAMFAMDIQRGNYYDYFLNNVCLPCTTAPGTPIYRIGSWEDSNGNTGTWGLNPVTALNNVDLANYDPTVLVNDVWLGNYDYASGTFDSISSGIVAWTTSAASMANSLVYASKPSWFGANVWPPIGGDLTVKTNLIPAQTRARQLAGFANVVRDGYVLTATNTPGGTVKAPGNRTYFNGAWVSLTAAPDSAHVFSNWSGYPVANTNTANTYLIMPAANVSVTANFTALANYTLTVSNGVGGGSYQQGSIVSISALAAPAGQTFAYWAAPPAVVSNPNSSSASLIMPASNVVVSAVYQPLVYYNLAVGNGYSDGGTNFLPGTTVSIHAGSPSAGESFDMWTGSAVSDAFSPDTTLIMPAGNVTVTATFSAASGSQPDLTITNGLVAWYKFDEGSGTNMADSSGMGNNGYLVGSPKPAWVAGKYGNALQFDGAQNYAIGGTAGEPVNSNFTVTYWANLPPSPAGTVVSTWEAANWQNNWCLNWNSAQVNGLVGGPYNTAGVCSITLSNVPTSNWHHFALVVDVTHKKAQYYVDDVLTSTNFAYVFNNTAPIGPNPLSIGSQKASSAANCFNGALDDLRIYNRVLSSDEIQAIYAGSESSVTNLPPVSPPSSQLSPQPLLPPSSFHVNP